MLFLLPSLADLSGYQLHIIELILVTIPLAIGLLISMGHCGQINLAQVALYGVGAYTTAILISRAGVDPWPRLVAGTLAGGVIGIVVGLPSLRIRGHYLAIATLGLAVAAETIFTAGGELTGGPLGSVASRHCQGSTPRMGGMPATTRCSSASRPSRGSLPGCSLRARSARPSGRSATTTWRRRAWESNVGAFQLLAFTISGLLAGLAGSLYATWSGYISPDSFRPSQMFFLLTILVVGGMRSLPGRGRRNDGADRGA